MPRLNSYRELEHLREGLKEQQAKYVKTVMICGGPGCHASRSQTVIEAIKKELEAHHLTSKIRLLVTGCHGFCEVGPLMVIEPGNLFYCRVSPDDAFEIVTRTGVTLARSTWPTAILSTGCFTPTRPQGKKSARKRKYLFIVCRTGSF